MSKPRLLTFCGEGNVVLSENIIWGYTLNDIVASIVMLREGAPDGSVMVSVEPIVTNQPYEVTEMKCGRCNKETTFVSMSFFDTAMLCERCEAKEKAHPRFERARKAESEATRAGNYNFPGIGKPHDL